ncbi:MAG: hypothetical protein ACRDHI_13660 [Actinomycetota bacterium]
MRDALRRHVTTIVVAFVTASVAAGGTAIAIIANAHKVDGYHANQLTRLSQKQVQSEAFAGGGAGTVLKTSIRAPKKGYLFIVASSDVFNLSDPDRFQCFISLNGADLPASRREIQLSPADNNEEMDCGTQIAWSVKAGKHVVRFETTNTAATTIYDESTLEVLFFPFNGSGNVPKPLSPLAPRGGASNN